MNGSMSKEQRRHLRKEVGDVAAAAVGELRGLVQQVRMEHQVLARDFLRIDTDVAGAREAHAQALKRFAAIAEQLQNLSTRLGEERTHRLQLAEEQRRYVDAND